MAEIRITKTIPMRRVEKIKPVNVLRLEARQ